MWKESGVPEEKARVQAGDHQSLSHTTTVDHGVRTGIAAVTKRVHCPLRYFDTWSYKQNLIEATNLNMHMHL